jgi:hypothetical protein
MPGIIASMIVFILAALAFVLAAGFVRRWARGKKPPVEGNAQEPVQHAELRKD